MSNFIIDEAGKLINVQQFEEIAIEEAQKIAEELEAKLTVVRGWLQKKSDEQLTGADSQNTETETPVTPAETAPVDNPIAPPAPGEAPAIPELSVTPMDTEAADPTTPPLQ